MGESRFGGHVVRRADLAVLVLLAAFADQDRPRPGLRSRVGTVAGSLSNRVLQEVDPEVILQQVDVNGLLDRVDVDRLLERVDVDALLARVDVDALLARVDVDALLARVDVDALLDRADVDRLLARIDVDALVARVDLDAVLDTVDLDRALERVDIEGLVRRAGIPELIADSTGQVAGSALDLGRRQLVGLDLGVVRLVQRVLGIDARKHPPGPAQLVSGSADLLAAPEPERPRVKARMEVSGFYGGPVSRVLALAGDISFVTFTFTVGAAVVAWLTATVLGVTFDPTERSGWLWGAAFLGWILLYWWASTAVAGRTPAMLIAGLRIVARDGSPLGPGQALLRSLTLPVSLAFLGLGGIGILIDRERRALHDLVAGSAVVYDWGGRPAELPAPISRWIEQRAGD